MSKEFRTKSFTVLFGYTRFKSFGIGFHIDGWTAGIDLGVFWIGVEW
jgi:hypothetical protein